jgi:CRISP-associated protein Cas1
MADDDSAHGLAADRAEERGPRPKTLPLFGTPPEVVPARMVNEVLYCERLAYLEWAQGEFADNHFTVEGRAIVHQRVDERAQAPAAPEEERPWKARSVWLTSERLGLTAKIDIVEADEEGHVAPVEYKRGKRPPVPEGAWLPERAQLCSQVLLLRDHGYSCNEAWIWYAGGREKVAILIDGQLEQATLDAIARLREVVRAPVMPPPLDNDPKCRGCSLAGICLPDEVHLLREQQNHAEDDADGDAETETTSSATTAARSVRRLYPAADDRSALYVQEQGARVGIRAQRLEVVSPDGTKSEARLPNTSQVCLFGNVQLSTQAIRALLGEGVPIAFFSTGGWFMGRTIANDTNNVELRVAQYRASLDETWRLRLSQILIRNKIHNQRTLLRRNHTAPSPTTLFELKQLARKVDDSPSRPSLLGLEGTAARVYFGAFTGMLKGDAALATFDLDGRNRRPPRDPINALLSFAYSLLVKEWTITLQLVGLDPLLGFLHETRFGRPALALDLMEPFRPIIADSVVIAAINNGEVTGSDFVTSTAGCALKQPARKRLLAAHERRMSQQITHPTFDYRVSYRRLLEVQARLLGRHLLGELDTYPELRTR